MRKHFIVWLMISLMIATVQCQSKKEKVERGVPTEFALERGINDVKLGYCYTIDELKEVFGTPTHYHAYGTPGDEESGATIGFPNIEIQLDSQNMVLYMWTDSPDFVIEPYAFLKCGESVSNIDSVPNVVRRTELDAATYLYIDHPDCDPIVIGYDKELGKITSLSCWIETK